MWVQVQTPPVSRPIWAVNWSEPDRLLVLGGGGLVELTLAPAVRLRTMASVEDLRRVFDPNRDCWLVWEGRRYLVNGPNGGGYKVCHPNGDRLILHPYEDDCLAVSDVDGEVVRQVLGRFVVSGDRWSHADFTDDYRYIVAFDSDGLRVFRHEPEAEPSAAADPARGVASPDP